MSNIRLRVNYVLLSGHISEGTKSSAFFSCFNHRTAYMYS